MIYIAYAVSGPVKRVFLDSLMFGLKAQYGLTNEQAQKRINIRGVYRQETEKYDGFEVVSIPNVDKLKEVYGLDYCYENEDAYFGVDKSQIEESINSGIDHYVLCNDSLVIGNIRREFGDKIKLLHITFKNYLNALETTCREYNDDVTLRWQKIEDFNRKLDESDINYDVEVEINNSISTTRDDLIHIIWEALKGRVNENYFYWYNLLNTSSFGDATRDDDGLRFEKDYSNVINSTAFRRLQDKAQVFPLEKHDYVRTRLTHSLECSNIAEELGLRAIKVIEQHEEGGFVPLCNKIPMLLKTAALLHDMGNPPFGHFGENIIRDWFKQNFATTKSKGGQPIEAILGKNSQEYEDLINFEGNAQLLRLVTKLSMANGSCLFGLDLTYATLATIIKYPVNSTQIRTDGSILSKKKLGYFSSESEIFGAIQEKVGLKNKRHPLTFLLEAADDISYLTSDIQDAHHKGVIDISDINKEFEMIKTSLTDGDKDALQTIINALNRQCAGVVNTDLSEDLALGNVCALLRERMICDSIKAFDESYASIMSGNHEVELLDNREFSKKIVKSIRGLLKTHVYDEKKSIAPSEITASRILSKLLEVFVAAVLEFNEYENSSINSRIHLLISENYKHICRKSIDQITARDEHSKNAQILFHKLLLATDYICGMTDSYAKEMYTIVNASV